jgi:hypothetical protein
MMRGLIGVPMLLGAMACASVGETPPSEPVSAACRVGTLAFLPGPDPTPVVSGEATRIFIEGDSVNVPSGLEGAVVEVCGPLTGQATDGTSRMGLLRLDLRAIDGAPAYMGRLTVEEDRLIVVGVVVTWRLRGAPAQLRGHLGQLVWVRGDVDGDNIDVRAYGVLE